MLALLRVELDVAEQFIRLSKKSNEDESHNHSLGQARRAYDTVVHFSSTISATPAEYDGILARLGSLTGELEMLGEAL